jgi:membrane associated rhomboid family serine protease
MDTWCLPGKLPVLHRCGLVTPVAGASLVCLGLLGVVAARAGGARPWVGTLRVVFWGALAMGLTAAIGKLFGVVAALSSRCPGKYQLSYSKGPGRLAGRGAMTASTINSSVSARIP